MKYRIIESNHENSEIIKEELIKAMNAKGFQEDGLTPDFVISIGGDGTFIQSLVAYDYDTHPYYFGINNGHLGFMMELDTDDIHNIPDMLIDEIYKVEKITLLEAIIHSEKGSIKIDAFNEVKIVDTRQKALHCTINIDNEYFEDFVGDALLVSTPNGSTAYNKSAGGAIVFPTLKTLQITPICNINSSAYKSLESSVIVSEKSIIDLMVGDYHKDDITVIADGIDYKLKRVTKIEVVSSDKEVKLLKPLDYNFWKKLNDKFLK